MSRVETVRGLINQRLSAAAAEIFELFERTIAEYEEQLCRSKEENERQRKRLEAVCNPKVHLHRADVSLKTISSFCTVTKNAQQLMVNVEEVPPDQQDRSLSLDQEDNPEPPHIKEEEEEEEEEEPQSSPLHETQSEEDRETDDVEDCEESEPDYHSEPETDEETSNSESETRGHSCDSGQISDNSLQNKEAAVSDEQCKTRKRSITSSECALGQKDQAQKRSRTQRDKKPFSCSDCGKRFSKNETLLAHQIIHTKTYPCTFCEKFFLVRLELERHMRSHTGEKPYSCSVCSKSFTQKSNLFRHQKIHTREKPYSCSLCAASFRQKTHLDRHIRTHTGERPFSCSVCRKTFSERGTLQRHSTVHTKQKLFSCSGCDRSFTRPFSLTRHKCERGASS